MRDSNTAASNGPVWVVTLMKYDDGAERSGAVAVDGGEVVFDATVDTQFFNPEPAWDRVAIVKYDSAGKRSTWSHAGVTETIVVSGAPIGSPADRLDQATAAPDWSTVPHPPTDDDSPVEVLHLIRYHEPDSINEMHAYTDHAMDVAIPNGVRVAAWFGVDETLAGDGRRWDQARFNNFPSKAAFMAVALDPDRLKAQAEHREVAIADTYTLILRPTIDRIAESVAGYRAAAR